MTFYQELQLNQAGSKNPFYDRWCIRKFNECIDRQHGNTFLNSFK